MCIIYSNYSCILCSIYYTAINAVYNIQQLQLYTIYSNTIYSCIQYTAIQYTAIQYIAIAAVYDEKH